MNNLNFSLPPGVKSLVHKILLATGIITIIVLAVRMIDAASKRHMQSTAEKK